MNGHVSTRNKATGRPERPCLISVSATREQFTDLVLTDLDPSERLRHLNALVSPHPWDLEAVRPIFDPDLSKYRFVDAHDAAAGFGATCPAQGQVNLCPIRQPAFGRPPQVKPGVAMTA